MLLLLLPTLSLYWIIIIIVIIIIVIIVIIIIIIVLQETNTYGRVVCLRWRLRWFETVLYFPLQLNFMKVLLICSKRLLLVVDSRCCNNLSTYKLLYSH